MHDQTTPTEVDNARMRRALREINDQREPGVTAAEMRAALELVNIPLPGVGKTQHDPDAHHRPRLVSAAVVDARRAKNKRARRARRVARR